MVVTIIVRGKLKDFVADEKKMSLANCSYIFVFLSPERKTNNKNQIPMETKKYTNHFSFWMHIATFIVFAISLILDIINIRKRPNTLFIVLLVLLSISLVIYLVLTIKEGLAWNSFLEISDEGVKMKGCAKRIYNKKKETIDDIFIPWGDVEEINRSIDGPVLVLKTDEKIKLTQQMEVNCATFQNALDHYKFIQQQKEPEQSPNEIVSVISMIDEKDKSII